MENKWNYGIDLLRVVAMFMICVLHTLLQGGVMTHCDFGGVVNWGQYYMCYALEILTFVCVDIYALISGYVGYRSKFKISKIINYLIIVLFYTLSITLIFQIAYPSEITKNQWLNAIQPIMRKQYWYMTAYFALLMISPILNAGIENMNKRVGYVTLILMYAVFALIPSLLRIDPFALGAGYSFVWLTLLYIAGGIFKKFEVFKNIPFYFGLIVYFSTCLIEYILVVNHIKGYLSYTSFLTVLGAVGLLQTFSKINIKRAKTQTVVRIMGEASLAVYLIHVHPLIWNKFMKNYGFKSKFTETTQIAPVFFKILLGALSIYLICTAIELIRMGLFKLIRYKKVLKGLDTTFEKWVLTEKKGNNLDGAK